MGCIGAGVCDEKKLAAAESYGECIGLAFQIVDDILDVTSTTDELGKPVGSDEMQKKATYVSLLGIEKCRETANEMTNRALACLDVFDGDKKPLRELALALARRGK